MQKHTCKNCNRIFEYCRGCFLSPIPHMDAGFCSKECYEASKNKVEPEVKIEPIIEETKVEPIIEETVIEDFKPVEEEVTAEAEVEAMVSAETTQVTKPTIKNDTYNAYKKKKNKHK